MNALFFPKYYTKPAMSLYVVLLLAVSAFFYGYNLSWYWVLFGVVEVFGFFYFANSLPKRWAGLSERSFVKRLFWVGFIVRAVYVVFSYFFYDYMTGMPFMFHSADEQFYHDMGQMGHQFLLDGEFEILVRMRAYAGGMALSDSGYPLWLMVVYTLTDNSVFLTRIVKSAFGAWTAVLCYRLASRNFGEGIGRLAAVLILIQPNLIYYCGTHLKEIEMLFLAVGFVESADRLLREDQLTPKGVAVPLLFALALFMFRTALGAVAVLSFITALAFSSRHVLKPWKRNTMLGFVLIGFLTVSGGPIMNEVQHLVEQSETNQENSMKWRAERKTGNKFARHASKSVFAPLIFTIPFSSMVETEGQENQMMIHGGNFVKNVTSFFTILSMFVLLFSGEWRKHVLMISFMVGYLVVLAFSAFAHSERFHLPALPFAMMFVAYMIPNMKKMHKRWFLYWILFVFVADFAWQWFKLAGRGLL